MAFDVLVEGGGAGGGHAAGDEDEGEVAEARPALGAEEGAANGGEEEEGDNAEFKKDNNRFDMLPPTD